MKKLYKFKWNHRYGTLDGLFISTDEEIRKAIGRDVYFGEILGKHSEVFGCLDDSEIVVVSDNQSFVKELEDLFGAGRTICGYNPLNYLRCSGCDGIGECFCNEG